MPDDLKPLYQGNSNNCADNKNDEKNVGHHRQVRFFPICRALKVAYKYEKVGTEEFKPLHPNPVSSQGVYHAGIGCGDVGVCVIYD